MLLSQKVQAIEEVFALLDQEMSKFRGWSGLSCKIGCGKCCMKSDIEATILEFLPFAYHLYLTHQCSEWLQRISENKTGLCVIFQPVTLGSGHCTEYAYRGLICRLFGFSARTDKYARKEFVSCHIIKSEQTAAFDNASAQVAQGAHVPVMNQYYMRMLAIDNDLARDFYPINQAIRQAIETVLHYYAYRRGAA